CSVTAHSDCAPGRLLRGLSRARPCGRRSRPWIFAAARTTAALGGTLWGKAAMSGRSQGVPRGMSVSPLERATPALATLRQHASAPAAGVPAAIHGNFRPLLGVLTAFWIYVALSNVMYANNMQASLSVMNIHNVFAPWDARVIQHLVLYPLFILSMRRALRTG